jgi:KaiC/GvpD/RAD55 family RecA-like ATPase
MDLTTITPKTERYVLSALRYRKIYNVEGKTLDPNSFASAEAREAFYRIEILHKKSSKSVIPHEAIFIKLPKIKDIESARAIVADYATRAQLQRALMRGTFLLNKAGLLRPRDLGAVALSTEDAEDGTPTRSFKDRLIRRKEQGKVRRFKTGLRTLTKKLQGGFGLGELIIVSAPPYGGKTHWMTYFGISYAKRGFGVVHIVLEDGASDVYKNYRKALGRPLTKVRNLALLDFADEKFTLEKLEETLVTLSKSKEFVLKDPTLPLVVIVDYAEIMWGSTSEERHRQSRIVAGLRRIANKHKGIVITGTQSKASAWNSKYHGMESLSESTVGKAAVVDILLAWSQMDQERRSGQGRLKVDKARGRKLRSKIIRCRVNWDTMKIRASE